jgi:hypothetical protein
MAKIPLVMRDGEGWRFTLGEPELTFIRVDYQTRLQFGSTQVVIEQRFDLTANDVLHSLDPANRSELGPLLDIYPDLLAEATADRDRVLRLAFVSGAQIVVPPHERYEAWSIVGPGTGLVVCTPGTYGGELAIWS